LLSHVFTAVVDFDRAYGFYSALLEVLEVEPRFHDPTRPWAGWQSAQGSRPLFVIGRPHEGAHDPGNGQMIAFAARTRVMVREAHALALALGAKCEGEPGLRPHYHPHYYGAYCRDPDGNKICVVCHDPEP
jgi:catechol 2,3-dioxygenase-like lactoylglutathione lyase family enzyme